MSAPKRGKCLPQFTHTSEHALMFGTAHEHVAGPQNGRLLLRSFPTLQCKNGKRRAGRTTPSPRTLEFRLKAHHCVPNNSKFLGRAMTQKRKPFGCSRAAGHTLMRWAKIYVHHTRLLGLCHKCFAMASNLSRPCGGNPHSCLRNNCKPKKEDGHNREPASFKLQHSKTSVLEKSNSNAEPPR